MGLETDISYVDIREDRNIVTVPLNGIGTLNNTFSTRMEYFGTVRGRVGYAWDRTLLYATGGLAYADIENSVAFFGPSTAGGLLQFQGRNRRTEAGYTVGAGIEHAFASNWTVKAEYLYLDFGSLSGTSLLGPVAVTGACNCTRMFHSTDLTASVARVGVNYRFNGY
jgi:outer membrane immunogenic protein